MRSFLSLFVAALAATTNVLAFPANGATAHALESGDSKGGFYSIFTTDGLAQANYTNADDGRYIVEWDGSVGSFIGGKGWKKGAPRAIEYDGKFSTTGNGYLAVNGWFTNPLAEYFIVETYGTYRPSTGAQLVGEVYTDGAYYNVYKTTAYNASSIEGTATYDQYLSVRSTQRTSGTVSTINHFSAFKDAGLKIGEFDYQILATQGYYSTGSADITLKSK